MVWLSLSDGTFPFQLCYFCPEFWLENCHFDCMLIAVQYYVFNRLSLYSIWKLACIRKGMHARKFHRGCARGVATVARDPLNMATNDDSLISDEEDIDSDLQYDLQRTIVSNCTHGPCILCIVLT